MKHTLLTQLDSKISSIASELDQVQALTLAGLSISRLWTPFEKWALENKAPKLIEWGKVCFNTLWDQISLEQLFGRDFDKYYRYLDKIDGVFDVFGVDWSTPMNLAQAKLGGKYVLQGNLEPSRLYDIESMERGVDEILSIMGKKPGHIFNLGHGMLPDLPRENTIALVKMVRDKSRR